MSRGRTAVLLCGACVSASLLAAPPAGGVGAATAPVLGREAGLTSAGPVPASPGDRRNLPRLAGAASSPAVGREAGLASEHLIPAGPGQQLRRPRADGTDGRFRRHREPARFRYAISVVAIPVVGRRMGVSRRGMATMVDRIGQRMKQQSAGRVTYRFRSWTTAPRVRDSDLTCNVDKIRERYAPYAKQLQRTPRGFTDAIALFITPLRRACRFAGSALLGGDATYLNGVFLRDQQNLQDWITAHEIGHNLTLVHSGSFYPGVPGWDIATRAVPQNERSHLVAEYGDHLDLMGAPPRGGRDIAGADYARWTLDAISQANLGALRESDVEMVERSGSFELVALRPGGTPRSHSALAIPVLADRTATFWVLEYRPAESNAVQANYPAPWSSEGYGVRLVLYEHLSRRWYHINKVLRTRRSPNAPTALPAGQPIRLGGGSTVEVVSVTPQRATVVVTIPGAEAEPGEGAAQPSGGAVQWRG